MAISQTSNGPRFTMTEPAVGVYDVVIDGADFLGGTARLVTSADTGFVKASDPVSGAPLPTPMYPVHVQGSTSMRASIELAIGYLKLAVGDNVRAKMGRDPILKELVALASNMAASKFAALDAWEATA